MIERLAPSLEKHKGCDIIDINPGPCIWSSKLHKHLKPRTHLLLEPDTVYKQFYEPLLQKKNSKYKLIPKHGVIWETLDSLGEHLPHQELLLPGDPRQNAPNNTLLFTADLGHLFPAIYGFKNMSHLFLHQLMSACRNHSLFYRYGLVRMLIWMDDRDKMILCPRTVSSRTKFAVELEINFESIVEVASSDASLDLTRVRRREHPLQLQRAKQSLELMDKAGIKTPDGRALTMQIEAAQKQGESSRDASYNASRQSMAQLEDLESRWKRGEFTRYVEDPTAPRGKTVSEEYLRMSRMQHRRNFLIKEYAWLDEQIARHDSIIAQEESLGNLPADEASSAKEEIKKLWETFLEDLEKRHYHQQAQFFLRLDDRLLFYKDPPVLHWDRQPFMALKVKAEEFFPAHELALLDVQPKALEPIFRPSVNYDHFEYIVASFFTFPTQSIESAMRSLAPGAFEWLIPECPSLTDVSKGGYSDLNMVRVRIMTREQWKEILTAWMNWPFRPNDEQVLYRLGGGLEEESDDSSGDSGANRAA